jgi:hypothetical protein
LFIDAVSISGYTAKYDRIINEEGYGRKRSWPSLRYYSDVSLERLEKNHETSVRTTGLRAEI